MNPHQKPQEDVVGLPFRLLASRGRFPSGGTVPYDVTSELIQQAYEAGRRDMREAAGKVCDGLADTAAMIQVAVELHGGQAPIKAAQREAAATLAAAIRNLPTEPLGGEGS